MTTLRELTWKYFPRKTTGNMTMGTLRLCIYWKVVGTHHLITLRFLPDDQFCHKLITARTWLVLGRFDRVTSVGRSPYLRIPSLTSRQRTCDSKIVFKCNKIEIMHKINKTDDFFLSFNVLITKLLLLIRRNSVRIAMFK